MMGRALAALVIWGVAFGSPPAQAQAQAQAVTTTPSSWTLDVGMSFSPWFGTYADAICCQALGGWVALRKGRLGFQFDHVGGWSNEIYDHLINETVLYEQTFERHRNRITTGLVDWQVFRSRRVMLRVRGGIGVRAENADVCHSRRGEPFADEELRLCEQRFLHPLWRGNHYTIQGGIAVDFPISERAYARVETRLWEVRLGVGFGF